MAEQSFVLAQLLEPELQAELAKTRRALERATDEHAAFKPHEKSTKLGDLCNHLTTVSGLAGTVLTVNEIDMGSPTDPRRIVKEATLAARLAAFDELAPTSLESLKQTDDDSFQAAWQAMRQGRTLFTGTRYSALRNFCMHHMIHHRAQLGVYLRLLDLPVPALFGPSADES